jgi:hypothetical protein
MGRQRPADLSGVAVPAGVCRVGQSHGSADPTTGHSELWLTGSPGSSRAWRGLAGATRSRPGTGGARAPSGCRPGACSASHRDHPADRRAAARRVGLGALAGLARDT